MSDLINYVIDRYGDKHTQIRALCHALACGIITGFVSRFSPFGLLLASTGIFVEIYQFRHDPSYDLKDGVFDAIEWSLGGLVFGLLFYLVRF